MVWFFSWLAVLWLSHGTGLFAQNTNRWEIRKPHWDSRDFREFGEFVTSIGESRCRTVNDCLRGSGNPFRQSDPPGARFVSDCADWPYTLLAYFAWKKGLPFAYASSMSAFSSSGFPGRNLGTILQIWNPEDMVWPQDVRYSLWGNRVTSRRDFTPQSVIGLDPLRALREMTQFVSTAMFRTHPAMNLYTLSTGQVVSSDFYPVAIQRGGVRPGTVFYDPSGHVAIVYKIGDDGRVYMMDGHPDQSITYIQFGEKFQGSRRDHGAGFKNFRPLRLAGHRFDQDGKITGGRIEPTPNESLPDYSDEQYLSSRWREPHWQHSGERLSFYDFVRARLSLRGMYFQILEEFENSLLGFCQDLQDRIAAVDEAIRKNLHQREVPPRYPNNIYGTTGEWEEYSTPSRDARLKAYAVEIRQNLERMVDGHRRGERRFIYQGTDLRRDLESVYRSVERRCTVTYRNSQSQPVTLTLTEVLKRLFRLSYNPYHCVELRWGAELGSQEFSTCQDTPWDIQWYEAEQRLRNQIERTYDVRMDFTIDDLRRRVRGSGVDQAPDVDILGYILRL